MPEKQNASTFPWFPGVPAEIVAKALEEPFGEVPSIGLDPLSISIIGHAIYGGGQEMATNTTINTASETIVDAIRTCMAKDQARRPDVVSAASVLLSKLHNTASLGQIAYAEAAAAVGMFVGATLARMDPTFQPSFPDIAALRTHIDNSVSLYRKDVVPAIDRLRTALDGHGADTSKGVA